MDSKRKGGNDFYFLFGQITASRGNEDDEKWAKSTSRVINVAISVLRCRVWNITSHGRVALRAHGSVTFPLSYETRKWPRIPPPLLATTMPPPSLLSGGVVKSDTIRSFFYGEIWWRGMCNALFNVCWIFICLGWFQDSFSLKYF